MKKPLNHPKHLLIYFFKKQFPRRPKGCDHIQTDPLTIVAKSIYRAAY